ncbi:MULTISPECIES: hypothetical protein [Burkholderia]|uniref:hypothetical protein n=1 Tax=Burkholderia TaxID=32008 RepID=UPI001FC82278|nr:MULTISPECIES: hypothetical protein [Burkholderia]MCA8479546.1 hypothetical protein [Burkholderia multivorans]
MRIGLQSLAGSSARIERLRGFLAHFSRSPCFSLTSRPLLPRFSPSSRPLLVLFSSASSAPLRRCSPVSRSVQPRFVAVRVRFVAVPAPVVAEPVKCAPSSRGIGRPGRQVAVAKMPIVPRDYIVGAIRAITIRR